jgi:hypothetical protein
MRNEKIRRCEDEIRKVGELENGNGETEIFIMRLVSKKFYNFGVPV